MFKLFSNLIPLRKNLPPNLNKGFIEPPCSITYPKRIHFHKIEDHISLKNKLLDFLKLILSLKTMKDRICFEPPPMKREVAFSVVVCDNKFTIMQYSQ